MGILASRYFYATLVALIAQPLPAAAQTGFSRSSAEALFNAPLIASADRGDERPLPYTDSRRVAYDTGYREGWKEGEKDARRGDRFAYQDEREFRNGDRGYHRQYGDRERYRQSFRSGYAAGYSEAYRRVAGNARYGPYSGNGRYDPRYGSGTYGRPGSYDPRYGSGRPAYGYYSPAFDNGVRDGYEKGREDLRKNRSFDPVRHSWYRSGDRHYEREYGSRDEYKNIYRRGFQEGYERGFREGRYRW